VVVREEPEPRLRGGHADRARPNGAVRRRHAARGAERPLRGRVGGAVGALSRAPRPPLDERAPRGLGRPDDRGALGGRLRRGRHRASPPTALPARRVLGRLLPALPGRAAPRRLAERARRARPVTACRSRRAAAPEPRRSLLLSTGPGHGRVTAAATPRFARLLRGLGLPLRLERIDGKRGEWERQLVDGLRWAFGSGG
jgi:hypothetical protein